jgi:hypothetical protein
VINYVEVVVMILKKGKHLLSLVSGQLHISAAWLLEKDTPNITVGDTLDMNVVAKEQKKQKNKEEVTVHSNKHAAVCVCVCVCTRVHTCGGGGGIFIR